MIRCNFVSICVSHVLITYLLTYLPRPLKPQQFQINYYKSLISLSVTLWNILSPFVSLIFLDVAFIFFASFSCCHFVLVSFTYRAYRPL